MRRTHCQHGKAGSRQHKQCFEQNSSHDYGGATQPTLQIPSDDALTAVSNHISYFKTIDNMQAEVHEEKISVKQTDDLGKELMKPKVKIGLLRKKC